MIKSHYNSSLPCYTSCHDKSSLKLAKERGIKTKESTESRKQSISKSCNQNFNNYKKNDITDVGKPKPPKFLLPTVVVHPPSPESPESPVPDPSQTQDLSTPNNEISALEVSDSESEDSCSQKEYFLSEQTQEETIDVMEMGTDDNDEVEVPKRSESQSPLSYDSHKEMPQGISRKSPADNDNREKEDQHETVKSTSLHVL